LFNEAGALFRKSDSHAAPERSCVPGSSEAPKMNYSAQARTICTLNFHSALSPATGALLGKINFFLDFLLRRTRSNTHTRGVFFPLLRPSGEKCEFLRCLTGPRCRQILFVCARVRRRRLRAKNNFNPHRNDEMIKYHRASETNA
jgi:hypothetical protein